MTTSIQERRPWTEAVSDQMALGAFIAFLAGLLIMGLYGWSQRSLEVFASAALVAVAAALVAALAGFIFGLPRYSAVVAVSTKEDTIESRLKLASQVQAAPGSFAPSNNLEQISDWLTKLLLGAGLVQLGTIGAWMGRLIDGIAAALVVGGASASPASRAVAGSLIVFYGALGFLFGYISTTLWYQRRLNEFMSRTGASG